MRGNRPDIRGYKRVRKPRGIKKDGTRSMDLCPYCYSFNCDSGTMSQKFSQKIDRRHHAGVHPACGTNPCSCHSSLESKPQSISRKTRLQHLNEEKSILYRLYFAATNEQKRESIRRRLTKIEDEKIRYRNLDED